MKMSKTDSIIITCTVLFTLLFTGCSKQNRPVKEISNDDIGHNIILRPSFTYERGILNAGTAFVAHLPEVDTHVVITSFHIFGPNGGLDRQITAEELALFIKGFSFTDAFTGTRADYTIAGTLHITGAQPTPQVNKDIAAFILEDPAPADYLVISNKRPKYGEVVWLIAPVSNETSQGNKLHKATVVETSSSYIAIKYQDPAINLRATSGAPIVNSNKEVVAINTSGMNWNDDLIGIGNPCTEFKKMLVDSIKANE